MPRTYRRRPGSDTWVEVESPEEEEARKEREAKARKKAAREREKRAIWKRVLEEEFALLVQASKNPQAAYDEKILLRRADYTAWRKPYGDALPELPPIAGGPTKKMSVTRDLSGKIIGAVITEGKP